MRDSRSLLTEAGKEEREPEEGKWKDTSLVLSRQCAVAEFLFDFLDIFFLSGADISRSSLEGPVVPPHQRV